MAIIVTQSLRLLLISLLVLAESPSDSNINCYVSTISPVGNIPYNDTMPVNINMAWTVNTVVPFMYFNVRYSIDSNPKISIPQGNNPSFNSTAQGTELHFEYVVFPPSTTNTAMNIDISMLTSGAHELTIYADGEYNVNNDFIYPYDFQSSPIYFSVNYLATYPTVSFNPTPTPSPTASPTCSPSPSPTIEPTQTSTPLASPTFNTSSSPTQQSTTEPSFSDSPTTSPDVLYGPNLLSIEAGSIVAVVAIAVVVAVYFKKHKKQK